MVLSWYGTAYLVDQAVTLPHLQMFLNRYCALLSFGFCVKPEISSQSALKEVVSSWQVKQKKDKGYISRNQPELQQLYIEKAVDGS